MVLSVFCKQTNKEKLSSLCQHLLASNTDLEYKYCVTIYSLSHVWPVPCDVIEEIISFPTVYFLTVLLLISIRFSQFG